MYGCFSLGFICGHLSLEAVPAKISVHIFVPNVGYSIYIFLIRNTTDMQTKLNKINEPIPSCHIKSLFFFWYVTYFGPPHFLWNHISCGSDLISLLKLFWRPDCLFVNDITDITSFWRTDKYLLRKMKFLLIISPMWVRTHDVPDTCRVL